MPAVPILPALHMDELHHHPPDGEEHVPPVTHIAEPTGAPHYSPESSSSSSGASGPLSPGALHGDRAVLAPNAAPGPGANDAHPVLANRPRLALASNSSLPSSGRVRRMSLDSGAGSIFHQPQPLSFSNFSMTSIATTGSGDPGDPGAHEGAGVGASSAALHSGLGPPLSFSNFSMTSIATTGSGDPGDPGAHEGAGVGASSAALHSGLGPVPASPRLPGHPGSPAAGPGPMFFTSARDYTYRGDVCIRFSTVMPEIMSGRLDPLAFETVIDTLNAQLSQLDHPSPYSNRPALVEGIMSLATCFTWYPLMSLLVPSPYQPVALINSRPVTPADQQELTPRFGPHASWLGRWLPTMLTSTHYERVLAQLAVRIHNANRTVFFPSGFRLRDPVHNGLLHLEFDDLHAIALNHAGPGRGRPGGGGTPSPPATPGAVAIPIVTPAPYCPCLECTVPSMA
ncbi:hypothetical protein H696_04434 [Fonticula alba]|uniref:Ras modification protein ERF4 n=1 Tax=Fonticula alba TaxID=691883 RepID=A0A058Z420_FONAL|nr:hypothetical protein H696_04434 [Fonticula alba]KCV69014.1 hypothetical protein H696_04434 [Fonticula alba]|eukprot:XP_009496585.1 hypothetical protein H696_04434 [Fonticula alba]